MPRASEVGRNTVVPLLLHERIVLERARQRRPTHVASASETIASSFAAARKGAVVTDDAMPPTVQAYQRVVRKVLKKLAGDHPKVTHVLDDATRAATEKGEKTLIFCERVSTIRVLRKQLERRWHDQVVAAWQAIEPTWDEAKLFGATAKKKGIFQNFQARFTRGESPLSIALRESYAHTLFAPPDASGLPEGLWPSRKRLLSRANELLATIRVSDIEADRFDYRIARRCVDTAVAEWVRDNRPDLLDANVPYAVNLLDPRYLRAGIDLVEDEEERSIAGSADHAITWHLTMETFSRILHPKRPSIWFPLRHRLAALADEDSNPDPTLRGAVVEAVRIFLTRRQVLFLPELLARVHGDHSDSAEIREALESWWRAEECAWRRRVRTLLDYLSSLSAAERITVLETALKDGAFVRSTNSKLSRTRLQHAFNTPFFPMVLVGNTQLQEGLNLHRQCRRVVHHDLRWNPADIEQRTGRVDRHGSHAQRMWEESKGTRGHIEVGVPLLRRTIDPRRYRRVKDREKWLEFLLGRAPEAGVGELEVTMQPLPTAFAEDLRVVLSPDPFD
jgi:hypothetical protein